MGKGSFINVTFLVNTGTLWIFRIGLCRWLLLGMSTTFALPLASRPVLAVLVDGGVLLLTVVRIMREVPRLVTGHRGEGPGVVRHVDGLLHHLGAPGHHHLLVQRVARGRHQVWGHGARWHHVWPGGAVHHHGGRASHPLLPAREGAALLPPWSGSRHHHHRWRRAVTRARGRSIGAHGGHPTGRASVHWRSAVRIDAYKAAGAHFAASDHAARPASIDHWPVARSPVQVCHAPIEQRRHLTVYSVTWLRFLLLFPLLLALLVDQLLGDGRGRRGLHHHLPGPVTGGEARRRGPEAAHGAAVVTVDAVSHVRLLLMLSPNFMILVSIIIHWNTISISITCIRKIVLNSWGIWGIHA